MTKNKTFENMVLLNVYIDTDDDSNVSCSIRHKRFEDIEKCRAYLRNIIWELGVNIVAGRTAVCDDNDKVRKIRFYRGRRTRDIEDVLEKMWRATYSKLVFDKPRGNWDFKYEIIRVPKK